MTAWDLLDSIRNCNSSCQLLSVKCHNWIIVQLPGIDIIRILDKFEQKANTWVFSTNICSEYGLDWENSRLTPAMSFIFVHWVGQPSVYCLGSHLLAHAQGFAHLHLVAELLSLLKIPIVWKFSFKPLIKKTSVLFCFPLNTLRHTWDLLATPRHIICIVCETLAAVLDWSRCNFPALCPPFLQPKLFLKVIGRN